VGNAKVSPEPAPIAVGATLVDSGRYEKTRTSVMAGRWTIAKLGAVFGEDVCRTWGSGVVNDTCGEWLMPYVGYRRHADRRSKRPVQVFLLLWRRC
jgi:hypothetical protein